MPARADGRLHVFFVNVGQGDTTVIVTPLGRVMIIDAVRPSKVAALLNDLGVRRGSDIDLLLITHPHYDHYSGASRVVNDYRVLQAVFCPFWNKFGLGPPGYRQLVGRAYQRGARCQFLSGYARLYPDTLIGNSATFDPSPQDCILELLGPTNELIASLEEQRVFDTNHLSIMSRVRWNETTLIVAADAQMENWAVFDNERMMSGRGQVLRAAHHGSGNGTQWERLNRLKPRVVVVSSDLTIGNGLPDVTGASVFARYAQDSRNPLVALTGDVGTIEVIVDANGVSITSFGDDRFGNVIFGNGVPLTPQNNATNWKTVLINKAVAL